MRGLAFFRRTNVPGSPNLISYHSPHSLTWSWILGFNRFRGDEHRYWPPAGKRRDNNGLQWWFRISWLGVVYWHRQRPMWYRDMWIKERDERDRLEYEAWKRSREELVTTLPPPARPERQPHFLH